MFSAAFHNSTLAAREQLDPFEYRLLSSSIYSTALCDLSIDIALRQNTFVWLYSHLSRLRTENQHALDAVLAARLRTAVMRWFIDCSKLILVESEVHELLASNRIPHAYLRGCRLAKRLYENPNSRVSTDIDILIPEAGFDEAHHLFLKNGYINRERKTVRSARRTYMGQIELIHSRTMIPIDLNFRLSGNCGIGKVYSDMRRIWSRTEQLKDYEHALCLEDVFVDLVRHFVQGHDLSDGLLKTCSDTLQILRAKSTKLDWDIVREGLARSECVRGSVEFLRFAERHHSVEFATALAALEFEKFYSGGSRAVTYVIKQQVKLGLLSSHLADVLFQNGAIFLKFFTLDRNARLIHLLLVSTFPTEIELQLLTRNISVGGVPKRIICALLLVILTPGILLGVLYRLYLHCRRLDCL